MRAEFVRHVATLMAGRSAAMLISFLLIPVIARLFFPEHFGTVAFFVAVVGVIGESCSMSYQQAALLPKEDSKAEGLLVLSAQILTVIVLLMYVGLATSQVTVGSVPFHRILGQWVWLLPLGIWLFGSAQIMMSALNREKAYRIISFSDVGQALSTSGMRIGSGLAYGSSIGGLVISYLFGYLVLLAGLRSTKWHILRLVRPSPALRGQLRLAWDYKDFPIFNASAILASSISLRVPIFMLGFMYSPAVVGFYAMADRLIKAPMNVIGNSIRRVYLRKVAELRVQGRSVMAPYWKLVGVLGLSGLLPFLVLWFRGEEIMAILLGETWRGAGRYTEILAPFLYALWVTIAVPPTMVVFRRQGLWAMFQVGMLFARGGVFIVAYILLWEPEKALTVFAWVNVIIGLLMLMMAWWVMIADKPVEQAIVSQDADELA